MADKLEFNDDFSFGGLFGKKKNKPDDSQPKYPIFNDNELPPIGGTNNSTVNSGVFTDLNYTLINFSEDPADKWRLSDAVRGVQVFGGIGSGKSSGSGKLLALTFLKNGFGGLVLCGKPDERENWEKYARLTGRYDDLIFFDKYSGYEFNPLIYELTRETEGAGDTTNIVNLFMSVYKLGKRINGSEAKSGDSFWENALRRLLIRTIDLLKFAKEELSIVNIIDVISDAPYGSDFLTYRDELKEQAKQKGQEDCLKEWYLSTYCTACVMNLVDNLKAEKDQLLKDKEELTEKVKKLGIELFIEEQEEIEEREEELAEKGILCKSIERYFLKELANLAHETHSSLLEMAYGITEPFMNGILARQFAKGLNIVPEVTFNCEDGRGKIIILDYPVKNYLESGIYAQSIFKLLWQQSVERRKIAEGEYAIPVFLWADESQFFVSEYDMIFQTTARSSRACTVFLTQNISNYYAMMGGENAKSRVDSLLGNLSTKIFHANNDYVTNEWASNTIGKIFLNMNSAGFALQLSKTGVPSLSSGASEQLHYQVEPKDFTVLKSGGKENEFIVSGFIITAGKEWSSPEGLKNYKLLDIFQKSNTV